MILLPLHMVDGDLGSVYSWYNNEFGDTNSLVAEAALRIESESMTTTNVQV